MGRIALAGCPRRLIPAAVWELAEMADLFAKGVVPVAGGLLDQADAFLAACLIYWRERDRIRAEEMQKRR